MCKQCKFWLQEGFTAAGIASRKPTAMCTRSRSSQIACFSLQVSDQQRCWTLQMNCKLNTKDAKARSKLTASSTVLSGHADGPPPMPHSNLAGRQLGAHSCFCFQWLTGDHRRTCGYIIQGQSTNFNCVRVLPRDTCSCLCPVNA